MNTPIPTAEGVQGVVSDGAPGLDLDALARLANQMWSGAWQAVAAQGGHEANSVAAPATAAPSPVPAQQTQVHVDRAHGLPTPSAQPTAAPGADPLDALVAQAFALPGADTLAAQLQSLAAELSPPRVSEVPRADQHFYFVEEVPRLGATRGFNVEAVRRDFPALAERVHGKPLVWLDNAATTHKPNAVIDRIADFYRHENSNIHRAAHALAARATDAFEYGRKAVARLLNAASVDEIVFVRGATEAINLVAQSWGRQHVGAGDEIIVSELEHHANIVPWQQLAAEKGARLRVIPVDDSGQVLLDQYQRLLNDRTRIVAVTQVSNALGTIVPVKDIIAAAHHHGALVLVDGAQAVSHFRVDVQALDADFYVFSGHKLFGPTGIGALYGKARHLERMAPWQGGGNMIADVTFERTLYNAPPARFEAGTAHISGAAGLGAAIEYVERLGLDTLERYEHELLAYATRGLVAVPGLHLVGTARDKTSVLSFVLDGYRPEEVGKALDEEGIAVRSGHHCAQPILRRFGHEATVRPSLAFYNTHAEIDRLVDVVQRLAHARAVPRR